MPASFQDIVRDLMRIELKTSALYKNIAILDGAHSLHIRNVAKVLSFEENNHAEFYKSTLASLAPDDEILLDEEISLLALSEIKTLKDMVNRKKLAELEDILQFAYQIEVTNISVLKSIRDIILEKIHEKLPPSFGENLGKMLIEEEKHANNLQPYLKKETI